MHAQRMESRRIAELLPRARTRLLSQRGEREKIGAEGNGGIDVSRAFSFPSITRSSEKCSLSREKSRVSRICAARRVSRDSA